MTADLVPLMLVLTAAMLSFRVVPLLALKGRELPSRIRTALELIPAAAFAALVANDILTPSLWSGDPVRGLAPVVSALIVVPIARKSGSLIVSALAGMAAYAALGYAVSLAG